jgi:hypothetical protein
MNMNSEELKQQIERTTENWSFTKYNLLRMGTLVKLIDETPLHAPQCEICRSYLDELPKLVDQIPQLDEAYTRSSYEKQFNEMRTHFHKKHGFYAPSHYSARYSLVGILLFACVALILSLIQRGQIVVDYLFFGGATGLMIGYVLGSVRDIKIRKADKLI